MEIIEQTLLVMKGPPASGKTTLSRKIVEENPNKWIRVNRDDIRLMFGKYWVPNREPLVSHIEEECIVEGLTLGYNVVIDATNLNPKTMAKWERIASNFNVNLEVKEVVVSIEEAIKRDKNRPLEVGEETIRNFYKKYYPKIKE